jgi:hypothetical protein
MGSGSAVIYVAWSGDSQKVYFRKRDDRGLRHIWSVPTKGGTPTLLVRFEDYSRMEFATDDTNFYFTVAEREGDIVTLRLQRQ